MFVCLFLTSILSRLKIKKQNNFFHYSRSLVYTREVLDKACWSCRAEGQPRSIPTPGAGSTTQNISYCIHHFCCTIGNILSSSAKCTHPNHSPALSQAQPQNESKPRVKENQNAVLTFQLHRVASSVCQALGFKYNYILIII